MTLYVIEKDGRYFSLIESEEDRDGWCWTNRIEDAYSSDSMTGAILTALNFGVTNYNIVPVAGSADGSG